MRRRVAVLLPRNLVHGNAKWNVEMFIALGRCYLVGTTVVVAR